MINLWSFADECCESSIVVTPVSDQRSLHDMNVFKQGRGHSYGHLSVVNFDEWGGLMCHWSINGTNTMNVRKQGSPICERFRQWSFSDECPESGHCGHPVRDHMMIVPKHGGDHRTQSVSL